MLNFTQKPCLFTDYIDFLYIYKIHFLIKKNSVKKLHVASETLYLSKI